MKKTTEMKRQNIFLFYEKNDDDLKIDEKLVRLYMNRFIIEEDHQNEIVGVAPLTEIAKMNFQIAQRFHNLPDYFQQYLFFDIFTQWKTLKEIKLRQDVSIIHSGMLYSRIFTGPKNLDPFDRPVYDIHFIIGSSYYMNIYTEDWFPEKSPTIHYDLSTCKLHDQYVHPIEELIVQIKDQFNFFNFGRSFVCTFVCGHNFSLCKKSEVQQAYQSQNKDKNQASLESISSVNNDLEKFYHRMMTTNISQKRVNDLIDGKFSNEYKQLFLFRLQSDVEKISFLDKLFYQHSFSVGANPEILRDPGRSQISSILLDASDDQEEDPPAYFFPTMREPPRKNLKLIFLQIKVTLDFSDL